MVNRNSKAYSFGRFVSRLGLIALGVLLGKRWGRRPLDDFPKKN